MTNTSQRDKIYIIMARPKSMLSRAFKYRGAVVVLIRSPTMLQCCLNHESCVADVFGLSAKTNRNSKSVNILLKGAGNCVRGMESSTKILHTVAVTSRKRTKAIKF